MLVVAGLLTSLTVGAAPNANACLLDSIYTETLKVTIEPEQTQYVVGDTAKIHAQVMRPADTDPLGQGVAMPAGQNVPAPNVQVTVGLKFPTGQVFGWAATNATGEAVIDVKLLANRITPGTANAWAYAYTYKTLACTELREYGETTVNGFLTATAP